MGLDQILPQLFVGACPVEPADIEQLRKEFGITAVLNLQTEEDFLFWGISWEQLESAYRAADIQLVRVPVQDFNPEELRRKLPACVKALQELLQAGHRVLVHCTLGINRSPSVVVAYLHWIEGMPLENALTYVKQRRSCDPYEEAIRLATQDQAQASPGSS